MPDPTEKRRMPSVRDEVSAFTELSDEMDAKREAASAGAQREGGQVLSEEKGWRVWGRVLTSPRRNADRLYGIFTGFVAGIRKQF